MILFELQGFNWDLILIRFEKWHVAKQALAIVCFTHSNDQKEPSLLPDVIHCRSFFQCN